MAMTRGELVRVRCLFGGLLLVPLFLAGWLFVLQVLQLGELSRGPERSPLRLGPAAADVQRLRKESLPAPRGTILDRHGNVLAVDCEAYEVRAVVQVPPSFRADVAVFRQWYGQVVDGFADALSRDPELADRVAARQEHRQRIDERLRRALRLAELPASGAVPETVAGSADILVHGGVDVLAVVEALRSFDEARDSVTLHFQLTHRRVHPGREHTHGLVGFVADEALGGADGRARRYQPVGKVGIESWPELRAGQVGERHLFLDSRQRGYFALPVAQPEPRKVVHTTIDFDLQKAADEELERQASALLRDGGSSLPSWGAVVVVEVDSGDVLAAASWHRGVQHRQGASFTPYQSLFEPGSIVKPLVFAYAREHAGLDWSARFDCRSSGAQHERLVEETGRLVRDDHACDVLTPAGILMNSSNIGAVRVGARLSREQWRDYMDFYGFGQSLGLELPFEAIGGTHPDSFDPRTPLARFRRFSGSSFSFGYEHQVTALQMARAYLRMLHGSRVELRLRRAVEIDGQRHEAPRAVAGPQHLSAAAIDDVRRALIDVVSDDPHATGSHLHARMRRELGIDLHGVVAGKTGTAVSNAGAKGQRSTKVRNASFVGFLPVEQPRYLAVCVLQNDSDAKFYGGRYAAPTVVRLLLEAEKLEQRRRLRQGPQVSATPGGSRAGDPGWSGTAPGTSEAGR